MRCYAIQDIESSSSKEDDDVILLKARYIGITSATTTDHEPMEAFTKSDHPDFIQVNYSLLEPEAENRILPLGA